MTASALQLGLRSKDNSFFVSSFSDEEISPKSKQSLSASASPSCSGGPQRQQRQQQQQQQHSSSLSSSASSSAAAAAASASASSCALKKNRVKFTPAQANPSFHPKYLPRHPRLAAASVHFAFPHRRRLGRRIGPRSLSHAAEQRNPLVSSVSIHPNGADISLRIVVDIIIDNALGAEAAMMISEWGFNNLYSSNKSTCNIPGMQCYGHDWRQGGVYQWGSADPKTSTQTLPEE